VTWHLVKLRTETPPLRCAGAALLAEWWKFSGKLVYVEHINDRDNMRRVNEDPLCECEHLFRVKDYVSANGQQAVVCQKCLEMD